ncbi:unnamed protein product [Sphenostylis stenocarpa]|uniref:Small glutamine-rich tetratricopeptide repeat-containing protein alpha n=1 Tax=Sphenostylis stenocarpa TaxID=92480 RepID=A0AA86SSM7_9FABA|nr:unnamed protein product [Sphenostylis stenocarpa]
MEEGGELAEEPGSSINELFEMGRKSSRMMNMQLQSREMERSGCQQFNLKDLAESLKSLGNKAMQSKKYNDAIELYNCAIALNEKSAVYFCNRAAAYTQINKYAEAIQDCHKSIWIDPNYSKAFSRLGLIYYAQGNYRDAIDKGFRKALQLDPNNESVKENIRVCSVITFPSASLVVFYVTVAEQKLLEEQHRAYHNQNSRSSQEIPNQSAQGSRRQGVSPPFSSMPINPSNIASMLMNMASNATNGHQGSHPQEWETEETEPTTQTEIRIGGEDLTGAFQTMMEMLSGAVPPGQPQDQTTGRTAPN